MENSEKEKKSHILIVDDEASIRMTVEDMLEPMNCTVLHAENGIKAIEIVKNEDIDLIILDVLLPGMHGFDIAAAIRKLEKGKKIPILMMTAVYKKTKYQTLAKDAGVNSYVSKPIKIEVLFQEVSKLLNRENPLGAV